MCIRDRIGLIARRLEPQDIADFVGNQSIKLAALLDADRHRGAALLSRGQAKPAAKIDRRHEPAAQIQQARHLRRRKRHGRQPLRYEYVSNVLESQPKKLTRRHHRDEALGRLVVTLLTVHAAAPPVSYTHLRAHETVLDLVCRLL